MSDTDFPISINGVLMNSMNRMVQNIMHPTMSAIFNPPSLPGNRCSISKEVYEHHSKRGKEKPGIDLNTDHKYGIFEQERENTFRLIFTSGDNKEKDRYVLTIRTGMTMHNEDLKNTDRKSTYRVI